MEPEYLTLVASIRKILQDDGDLAEIVQLVGKVGLFSLLSRVTFHFFMTPLLTHVPRCFCFLLFFIFSGVLRRASEIDFARC